ncbi:alpha-L-rhamnosidase [Loigolactobacillus jiayinensis]|uniref:alpha-L-rhamnosidase n=1 Tax=Loigolactobacillus jiayinensis TaxID=2486016 RepID=A0ABW1RBH2_9LACO|nr:alpha-L-rhamnosidase [Loigolactobacillus jiayinensis]
MQKLVSHVIRNSADKWYGQWITADIAKVKAEPEFSLAQMFSGQLPAQEPVESRLRPPVIFYKEFNVPDKALRDATLTITAQGIYQATINGVAVTDAIFTPDYTAYTKFLQYQTYPVTELLKVGKNRLQIVVADGWFAGRVSVSGGSGQFGDQLAALADLDIEFADNTELQLGTDETFNVTTGKWRYADIDIGEKQDLSFSAEPTTEQAPAALAVFDYSRLVPQEGPQVRRQKVLPARKIWNEGAALIVDFGQVIAGRVRLTTTLALKQTIKLEHAEALNQQGKFFKNIVGRNKDQTDIFVGNGQKATLEPDFTFHGFRYVRITGLTKLDLADIQAVTLYSDFAPTGSLSTSNTSVNQLLQNIKWSQRGNMISIPTDCPQRERIGWTGDMQVFAPAATFYYDTDQFIQRWLRSVRADQQDNGEIVDYSPAPKDFFNSTDFTGSVSSAGWGDAIIMVPWTLYQRFGDQQVLKDNYNAMQRWFNFAQTSAAGDKTGSDRYIWDTKFHYGDWMFPSVMMKSGNPMETAQLTKDLVATAFLAHSADLLGEISAVLGDDSRIYRDYASKVKQSFAKHFITATHQLTSDFQGCYVLALAFDLVPAKLKTGLVQRLVEKIHTNNDLLDTGFLSVPYLLDVLVDNGQVELAKKVFLQEHCPSWLYEVKQGATTIWESWNGIQPDGTVGTLSFNHYAMGCVLDWFVRDVVGLTSTTPGYQTVTIAPQVAVVNEFDLTYQAVSGEFKIKQIKQTDGQHLTVTIPTGVVAKVQVPNAKGAVQTVGAGTYEFTY